MFLSGCSAESNLATEPPDSGIKPSWDAGEPDVGADAPDAVPEILGCETCTPEQTCVEGVCLDCRGPRPEPGRRTVRVGNVERQYDLYLPERYRCDTPWPLLIDLHGGAPNASVHGLGLEEAVRAAEEMGFILARPRSRYDEEQITFRLWDANEEELADNMAFVQLLLQELLGEFNVDPGRRFVSGFGNGSQIALRYWAMPNSPFTGVAIFSGGYWSPFALPESLADAPPLHVDTGYLDGNFGIGIPPLERAITDHGFPLDRYRRPEAYHGRTLRLWQYRAALTWLTNREPPAEGRLAPNFELQAELSQTLLLATATGTAGERLLGGAQGGVWTFGVRGLRSLPSIPAGPKGPRSVTGLCKTSNGTIIAAAESVVARLEPGSAEWSVAPPFMTEESAMLDVLCNPDGTVFGVGEGGFVSPIQGLWWAPRSIGEWPYPGGAFVHRVHRSEMGLLILTGLRYLGRSTNDARFVDIDRTGNYYGIHTAGDRVWVAGESEVLFSDDRGQLYRRLASLSADSEIYDVTTLPDGRVVAAGRAGEVWVGAEGQPFVRIESGVSDLWTGVETLGRNRVLLIGERGRVVTLTVP